jgi:dolichol-phosphate mannosyltransferase
LIHQAICAEWRKNLADKYDCEIIFVDDGSTDNSVKEIEKLVAKDERVKGVIFSKNFGHQAALEAGLKTASGDAVVVMDGDLQHPPQTIPDLITHWEDGHHIVNTRRIDSGDVSVFKKVTSKTFYKILNTIADIDIEDGAADFRLMDKRVVEELNKLTEKDKFYRGLVNWIGFNSKTIEYEAQERIHGKSAYGLGKMFDLARTGIISFSMLPMKLILWAGSVLFIAGSALFLFMLYYRFFVDVYQFTGTAMLATFIIANNGFMLLAMGIMSIYQVNMHKEIQNRPNYIVDEIIQKDNFENDDD